MSYEEVIAKLPQVMTITCACGRTVELELEGGQYQESYFGSCACGLQWKLVNVNAWEADLEEED